MNSHLGLLCHPLLHKFCTTKILNTLRVNVTKNINCWKCCFNEVVPCLARCKYVYTYIHSYIIYDRFHSFLSCNVKFWCMRLDVVCERVNVRAQCLLPCFLADSVSRTYRVRGPVATECPDASGLTGSFLLKYSDFLQPVLRVNEFRRVTLWLQNVNTFLLIISAQHMTELTEHSCIHSSKAYKNFMKTLPWSHNTLDNIKSYRPYEPVFGADSRYQVSLWQFSIPGSHSWARLLRPIKSLPFR